MREQTGMKRCRECAGDDRQPALEHQLSEARAAKNGRLPATVGAGDDHQLLAVRADIDSDHRPPHRQREAGIAKVTAAEFCAVLRHLGEGDPLADPTELLLEVESAAIEGEFRPQRPQDAEDVLRGLIDRIRDQTQSSIQLLAESLCACLVAST
jgi:hypothetical protein